MHIGFDLTSLTEFRTGVETAARELILSLARVDRLNRYTVFINREDGPEFRRLLPPSFRLIECSTRNRAIRGLVQQTFFPAASVFSSIDVMHSPAFLTPLFRARARQLVTIHDLTFFTMPDLHSSLHQNRLFKHAVKWSAYRADLIHVPSQATRDTMFQHWPSISRERVRVIPWGIGSEFSPAPPDEIEAHRRRLGLPDRFILFTGTIEPRKNVGMLIDSYARLLRNGGSDVHLVLAGRLGWQYESPMARLNAPEMAGRGHHLGHVDPEDLPWIYRAASLFVYPSHYEGFGLPPLEAMACGIPTIASSGSALESNLRGAAELIDPGNPQALAAAMHKLLAEPADARAVRVRTGLERSRQFSWNRTAQMMIDCYGELIGSA